MLELSEIVDHRLGCPQVEGLNDKKKDQPRLSAGLAAASAPEFVPDATQYNI